MTRRRALAACLRWLRLLGLPGPEVKKTVATFRAAIRGKKQEPPNQVSPTRGDFMPRNAVHLGGGAARTLRPSRSLRPLEPAGMVTIVAFVATVRLQAHQRQKIVFQGSASGTIDLLLAAFRADPPMAGTSAGLGSFFHRRRLVLGRSIQYCTPSGSQMMSNVRLRKPPRFPPRPTTVAIWDSGTPFSRR